MATSADVSEDAGWRRRRRAPLARRKRRGNHGRPVEAHTLQWRTRLSAVLPRGRRLPDEVWAQRHRGLVALLWLQVPMLFTFALYEGISLPRALAACAPTSFAAAIGLSARLSRRIRSASVALGFVVACSILVDVSGGAIEAHFSYFVVIAFLTLYQEWTPFLVAIVFVLFEHGIVGVFDTSAVYDHAGMPGMDQDPWKWAFIHAGFVLAASIANLLAWRLTEREALTDSLTGLPNRVLFIDSIERAWESADGQLIAVLFIDLDNFKDANDGFGHDSGDQLLRAIAARMRGAARYGDTIARLGGDEFGVVIQNLDNEEEAVGAAERYLATLRDPFALDGLALETSASVGLAVSAPSSNNKRIDAADRSSAAVALMRNADLAMYEAKRAGGAQVSIFRPNMHDTVVRRAQFESDLRGALARDEFVVHYQPLVNLRSGEIVGNEALVRWEHPRFGLTGPVDFIDSAERSGLIIALGRWVLRTACAQTAAWHTEHPDRRPLSVSVNVSPRQLADPHFIEIVASALADSGLDAQHLCLEITEGAVIKDFDGALPKLTALKAIGISLALDDFGTGYSSLSYLRQLPVDSLKIDRSFITDLDAGHDDHIVLAIIDLAHALGMSVTAEGVETAEQLAVLRKLSSDLAQGYLLGRPMPQQQLTQLLEKNDPMTTRITTEPSW